MAEITPSRASTLLSSVFSFSPYWPIDLDHLQTSMGVNLFSEAGIRRRYVKEEGGDGAGEICEKGLCLSYRTWTRDIVQLDLSRVGSQFGHEE